ncbi:MAG TPA: DNA polymerase IV [Balneolales bacterium]|nr:DNA polymerase IV [Balneolales bacterium]
MRLRKIIHIDMDAFYASVEQRDNPSLRAKAVIVGGAPDSRGVVATASYEARKFGVHSAMPSAQAKRLCPHGIFIKPRFDVYREISHQIREIFFEYTDLVEPLSMDEAYLDVTENHKGNPSATLIAQEIRKRIKEETGLTASAGIAPNKFLAKVASDINKPDGMKVIIPNEAESFIETLPIGKFHGIGKVTERRMQSLGIETGADLKKWSEFDLIEHFGKVGSYYYGIARGIDEREVKANRIRKSIGAENTFSRDHDDTLWMEKQLDEIAFKVAGRLEKSHTKGRTVTLKVRFANFQRITRSLTLIQSVADTGTIASVAKELLTQTEAGQRKIRLLGITVSNLDLLKNGQGIQLDLFENNDT